RRVIGPTGSRLTATEKVKECPRTIQALIDVLLIRVAHVLRVDLELVPRLDQLILDGSHRVSSSGSVPFVSASRPPAASRARAWAPHAVPVPALMETVGGDAYFIRECGTEGTRNRYPWRRVFTVGVCLCVEFVSLSCSRPWCRSPPELQRRRTTHRKASIYTSRSNIKWRRAPRGPSSAATCTTCTPGCQSIACSSPSRPSTPPARSSA